MTDGADRREGGNAGESGDESGTPPAVLLDVMCGTLATYLRFCGYDAAYALDRDVESDDRLLAIAAEEDRLLVTRDRELAARADAREDTDGVLLRERDVLDQLRELRAAGLPVELADEPRRCGRCNGPVERDDTAAADRPDYVPDDAHPVWQCRDCGQRFWKGGHWERVAERVDGV
ncbi:hypothetical protein JCM17823_12880 [Halorubrum gandharaense]